MRCSATRRGDCECIFVICFAEFLGSNTDNGIGPLKRTLENVVRTCVKVAILQCHNTIWKLRLCANDAIEVKTYECTRHTQRRCNQVLCMEKFDLRYPSFFLSLSSTRFLTRPCYRTHFDIGKTHNTNTQKRNFEQETASFWIKSK